VHRHRHTHAVVWLHHYDGDHVSAAAICRRPPNRAKPCFPTVSPKTGAGSPRQLACSKCMHYAMHSKRSTAQHSNEAMYVRSRSPGASQGSKLRVEKARLSLRAQSTLLRRALTPACPACTQRTCKGAAPLVSSARRAGDRGAASICSQGAQVPALPTAPHGALLLQPAGPLGPALPQAGPPHQQNCAKEEEGGADGPDHHNCKAVRMRHVIPSAAWRRREASHPAFDMSMEFRSRCSRAAPCNPS
jgi:hypothetical protein